MDQLKKNMRRAGGGNLLAAALLLAAPMLAGATGFNGRVTAEDGVSGVPSVTVQFLNPADDSVANSAFTDGSGNYAVSALSPGTYHLQVTPVNYFPAIRSSHTVTTGQEMTVNFALQLTGSEGFRDDFTAQNWTKHWDFTDPDSISNNANTTTLFVEAPVAGSKYVSYTRVASISNVTYPYVSVRHRYTTHHPAGGGISSRWLVMDKDGGWNYIVTLADTADQSTPWLDRTYAAPASVTTGMELVFGDAYNGIAPSSGTLFLDSIIFHSVDRGFAAGQVTGKYGAALHNARVQLRKGSAVVGEALTDAAGNYNIWGVVGSGYNIYVSSNGAEFVSGSLSLTGRTQTTANVSIDTAPPSATSDLWANPASTGTVDLYWTSAGDDWNQVALNNSSYTIQHATYTGVNWSTAAAQIILSTSGVAAGSYRGYAINNLSANTTYYFRLWTKDAYGTYSALSNGATAVTMIETPSSVYFDEVSTYSITASAYAASLSNLGSGLSGVNLTTGAFYGDWVSNGNSWSPGPSMPTTRYGAAGAAAGRKIYILGGTTDGLNFLSVNEEYDPATNSWTTRTGMGQARHLLAAAVLGGRVYALGGYNNLAGGTLNANEEYDPVANSWRFRAPLPTARERLAAVSAGGRIYALGGYNSVDYATNEIYDPAANTWKTGVAMPTARKSLAAAYLGGKIYAVGGNSGGYKSLNEEYDLASKTWSTRAAMPTPRDGLAAAVMGGKLYAVSGYNGSYLGNNEVYDPNANAWTTRAGLPAPRGDMAYTALNGSLYIAGGTNGGALNSAYQYNPGVAKAFTGLQPNTQYSLMVKARNQAGAETSSMGAFNVYTLAVATVPAGPAVQVTSPRDAQVTWSSGSQAGGYNGPNANYRVEASTLPNFSGELLWQTAWNDTQRHFSGLKPKTTYYFRVQAYNHDNVTDYSWVLLGSTRTPAEPLPGSIISTVAWSPANLNYNWSRATARDSQGNLYAAYARYHQGKYRIFVASSSGRGAAWHDTTPVPVETVGDLPSANSFDQYYPALAIDSKDVLHLVWGGNSTSLDGSGPEPKCVYSSAAAPGVSWSPHTLIPADAYAGWEGPFSIAVDGNDGLHIAWAGQNGGAAGMHRVRYSSRTADGAWTPYAELNNTGTLAEYPALAVDAQSGVHIAVRRANASGTNTAQIISYSSRPAAGSWGGWTDIYDSVFYNQSPPSLTITSDGRRFAAWSSADGTYSNSQVKYAVAPAGGAWGAMAYVQAVPEAPQSGPSAAADATGNVFVMWSGSDTANASINLKGRVYNGSVWDEIGNLTDEETAAQINVGMRWSGWRNNGGGIDLFWHTWDGASSTATLRHMQGPDVPMSPGWSKTPWPVPAGCGYALNVKQDGAADFTGIGQALNAVPQELSTTTCVVLRDDATYGEQVTVQGIQTGRWDANTSYRMIIMKDPTFLSSGPVISPPLASTAAFHIINASVTVQGFTIAPVNSITYGILASSESVTASSVNVVSGGQIWNAGISFNKRGLLAYSSVTVQNAVGVLLDRDLNTVSFSSITNASAANLALKIYNASSNTVTGSYISNAAGYGAKIYGAAHYNSVSLSTVTGTGSISYALSIDNGASNNEVEYCYLGNTLGSALEVNHQSNHNRVTGSTASAAGSGSMALYVYDSSSNTFSGSVFRAGDGYAVEFYGGAYGNTVQAGGIYNNSSASAALYISGASTNTVTGSYVHNPAGTALYLYTGSANNTVALSTVTSGASGSYALYMSGASSNTVEDCYVSNLPGYAAQLTNSNRNTIRRSTFTSAGYARNVMKLSSSMNNLIEDTYLANTGGPGVYYFFSNFNELRDSYVYAYQSDDSALAFYEASTNTVSGSSAVNPAGYGARLMTNSDYNRVIDSTITASPSSRYGAELSGVKFNEFDGFHVQGATAVYVTASPVNIFRGGTLLAQATSGSGLQLSGASGGIYLASSTVSGGAQGAALLLDPGYTDKIELDSNTITGAAHGLRIGAPGAGGRLQISTITFRSLTAGATAINFMGGQVTSTFTGVDFGSGDIGVTVNGSALTGGSFIGMRQVTGARRGGYENDPAGYVYWDPPAAMLVGPPDNPGMLLPFIPVSPALHARAQDADSPAQYVYQVDTAETMDSQGSSPWYSFEQASAQAYVNNGAFSGQDGTFFSAGDSYLAASTATFVFYSTGTRLTPNAQYYWRARVKIKASGEYGAWTSTASFFTGASASLWPVNDLAVTGVNLSSPSAQGVNVGFSVFANNVSTGVTPNGAAYNTAEWIFVKFSTQAGADGTWNHATLSGGTVGPGATLAVASDNKGVFLNHTANAVYWTAGATVTWNYAADGVKGGNAQVKVFAISMVKVPTGSFVYNAGGLGGSGSNNYGNGSQSNVLSATDRPTGAAEGWPNGYNSFYIMRYELTQGQYADFLNSVHSSTAAALYATETTYGHQMNNGGVYPNKYSAADRFAAKNYLSTSDLWSYLSWAALRPMTEMEFEKASRDISPDARTYPWSNTPPNTVTYNPRNEGGTHIRNFMNYNNVAGGQKVLASGRYMSGDVYRTPEQTGASPYGIADLAGNVWEHILNCSYLSVPANGTGNTAPPAGWPPAGSSQKGLRGGDWFDVELYARVSGRVNAGWTSTGRYDYVGGRGGRTQ